MPLAEGVVFAGYTLIRLLGSGGMGEVYLAQHPTLPRRDALKVLPEAMTDDSEFRERFNREAELAATLFHPHIVGVHDRGDFEGQLWIAMDYVDGTDAAQLVRDRYPAGMPEHDACTIVTAVAGALDYAHQRGLLHRDVKPANILLTHPEDGERRILLADFGVARQLADISGLTATDLTVGTVAYAAPEQLMGLDIDGRADQYALAATAFHLLTGLRPYQHSNPVAVISQHLNAAPPKLSDRRPDLASLDHVLSTALAKSPDQRYGRCRDFAAALSERVSGALISDRGTEAGITAAAPAPQRQSGDQTLAATQQRPPGWPPVPQPRPADRTPPQIGTPTRRRWWLRVGIPAALLTVAVIAAAIVITSQQKENSNGLQITLPTGPQHREPTYGPQVTLPFTGLSDPGGVAVDSASDLYVTSVGNNRVVQLAAGSATQSALPFTGLNGPNSVAVDTAGDLYVTDHKNNRVVELAAGSSTQSVLPFTGLNGPNGVAVDAAGSLYVTDTVNNRVLKLAAGSSTQTVLPFTGLNNPVGLAVDAAGSLYVTDTVNNRVLKLAAGATTQTLLPFTGLNTPAHVAVDTADNLYVVDYQNNRVLKLAAGSSTQTVLPFTGLNNPVGLAVDAAGNVYVVDLQNDRVVKLPAG
jgi:DNA-binding beta-propeller fold protein YncE